MPYRASVPQITATRGLPASATACRDTGGVDGSGVDRLDAAGRQQVGRERRPDVVLGQRSQRQQQHLRSRPGAAR